MATLTQTQQRISQLLTQDNSSRSDFDNYYRDCLQFISTHLQAFYTHYADETGLSLKQTQQRVNSWDLHQWKQAIDSIDMSDWDRASRKRAKVYGAKAGIDKTAMIGAIIGVGVLGMYRKYQQNIAKRVRQDGLAEIDHAKVTIPIRGAGKSLSKKRKKRLQGEDEKLTSIVDQTSTKSMWSTNIWLDADEMAADVQALVNKHLRHGMQPEDLDELLRAHDNPKQFKPNKSVADRLATSKSNARRLIITESQRVSYHVDLASMMLRGTRYVNWVTEPGACDNCQGLADMSPYDINDCPKLPEDSHPYCRCHIEPAKDFEVAQVTGFSNLN